MSEFLIVAGMSGAGRSTAARAMEDLGWFRVDNMPPAMFAEVARRVGESASTVDRVAFVAGTGAFMDELMPGLEGLRSGGHRVRILYLDASDEVLVRRFEGTRHRHPLAGALVQGNIERERELLDPLRAEADIIVDTSDFTENDLRRRMAELFSAEITASTMQTSIVSFGYKHGLPLDADVVLDTRFLHNPYWVPALQPLPGTDEAVRAYVLGQPDAEGFLDRVEDLVRLLMPAMLHEGKSYLTIALGCTGGRHRSVVIAEELARRLRETGAALTIYHRDIDK